MTYNVSKLIDALTIPTVFLDSLHTILIFILFTRSLGACLWCFRDISILPHSFGCLLRVRVFTYVPTLTKALKLTLKVSSSPGLFLFVQVIATFSVEDSRMKFRHYFLIGWGKKEA